MERCVLILLVACSARGGFAIDHVDPASGPSSTAMPVRIAGSGFLPISSNVDNGTTIVEDIAVSVGGVFLPDATWRNENLIEATIPAGLAVGPHDVTVTLGRSVDVLGGGYVVVDELAPDASMVCVLGPWGTPQAITELNTGTVDNAAWLSPDELAVYFHSLRTGSIGERDIFRATRSSLTAPFSTPVAVTELNTIADDRTPTLSSDGLIVVLSSTRGGAGYDLYMATRAATTQPFSTPVLMQNVNSTAPDLFESLSPDGLTLVYSSRRLGGEGGYDIYSATRATTTAPFSTPQLQADLSTATEDVSAILSADGLEAYLGVGALNGGIDVMRSTRPDVMSPFSNPVLVPVLSTPTEDVPTWLSSDGRRLYLSQDETGAGDMAIFVATRACL